MPMFSQEDFNKLPPDGKREFMRKMREALIVEGKVRGGPVGGGRPTWQGLPLDEYNYDDAETFRRPDPEVLRAEKDFNKASAFVIDMLRAIDEINMDDGARALVQEIVIGRVALCEAKNHGDKFDSFRFYAKCKGRQE